MSGIYSIVVTYNGQKWIDKCFGSLLQSTVPIEIIAIDNGSADGTPDIIRNTFPSVQVIQNDENLGFGRANNIGIRKAYDTGADYVFLLNQDAWIEPDTIGKLVQIHSENNDYGVVSPIHLNGAGNALDRSFSLCIAPARCPDLYSDKWCNVLKDKLYEVDFVNAAAWLVSRKCMETVGGFNPVFFLYGEDDNYIHRVKYHGLKTGIYPFAQIYHDRELRPEPVEKTDPLKIEDRSFLLRYSNPASPYSTHDYIRKIHRLQIPLKKTMKLQFRKAAEYRIYLKDLRDRATAIDRNRNISSTTGPSFL